MCAARLQVVLVLILVRIVCQKALPSATPFVVSASGIQFADNINTGPQGFGLTSCHRLRLSMSLTCKYDIEFNDMDHIQDLRRSFKISS